MIVKKMPILQGFPDFECVRKLSISTGQTSDFNPVFYDIETTGLSRNSTFLYLIGVIYYTGETWQMCQWMGESPQQEEEILTAFSSFLKPFTCSIQYNGDQFDQPYLEARLAAHQMENPFTELSSVDLYKKLKPVKALLKLPGMKQEQMENFLGISARQYCNGGECIHLYKDYIKNQDPALLSSLLGHNQEDLLGLGRVYEMMAYLCLLDGRYTCTDLTCTSDNLILSLELPYPLPVAFSNRIQDFYITGEGKKVRILINTYQGKARQYYMNYKEYDYIPGEDTIMPKSLTRFMDKSLRKPATKNNCYTWFDCTGAFLTDPTIQKKYLEHTLPWIIQTIH